MIKVGLDRLLETPEVLRSRRYGIIAHAASVSADLLPIHLALVRGGAPAPVRMFAPEHGFFGVEQDMMSLANAADPWIGVPVLSLYGESEATLRPEAESFSDVDLIVVDFQDIGSRYYTYAATAVWAAEAALAAGCEVWILDRPNPLGGDSVEGNIRQPGFESFVGAFATPVRHGLTLAELMHWALSVGDSDTSGLRVWQMDGWQRSMSWRDTGRRWVAPSPNIPTPRIADVYPGACLVEATSASEGRGTTRPFELIGSPTLDPVRFADRLNAAGLAGARFIPSYFRPQFQKHAGAVCGGVQWAVDDISCLQAYRCGIEIVRALEEMDPEFAWREEPYEFVSDRPAIDLLTGTDAFRLALDGRGTVEDWLAGWEADSRLFREASEPFHRYHDRSRSRGGQ
ncbi:MAG: DUF1343 domain-containing protein [Acidobacteriota bacterium]|nr:DUF1343 domain-containing protein [Acidobacteriota bacterium]